MEINLIAVGKKMPTWINHGFNEYAKRMPSNYRLRLTEINPSRRTSSSTEHIIKKEGELILAAIPKDSFVIALVVKGEQWTTCQLSERLLNWHDQGQDICLLVGGPEGLDQACLEKAKLHWSLSLLTYPHPLVRVIIAEQLYRAWSIISHHPYHRS